MHDGIDREIRRIKVRKWMADLDVTHVAAPLKIMIGWIQILTALTDMLKVPWPEIYMKVMDHIGIVFQFEFFHTFCFYQDLNFYDTFVTSIWCVPPVMYCDECRLRGAISNILDLFLQFASDVDRHHRGHQAHSYMLQQRY